WGCRCDAKELICTDLELQRWPSPANLPRTSNCPCWVDGYSTSLRCELRIDRPPAHAIDRVLVFVVIRRSRNSGLPERSTGIGILRIAGGGSDVAQVHICRSAIPRSHSVKLITQLTHDERTVDCL